MRRFVSMLLVLATAMPSIAWSCTPDNVALGVQRGATPDTIDLSWSGASGPYRVYRSAGPAGLVQPSHQIATVAGTTHADNTFGQDVLFYQVAPDGGATAVPVIGAISPAGARFGDVITIDGCGFGTDRTAVHVRFSYTEGGETLVANQPVFWTTGTRLSLMMPLAATARVNTVEVIVGAAVSAPVPYFVGGPLPDDPTPATRGNEILAFVDQLDTLVSRFDGKLDRWFIETGTLTQADVDMLHGKMGAMRVAVAQMRATIASQPANTLGVLDTIAGTPGFAVLKERLDRAVNALHGSPLGTVLCEGNELRDVVYDILDAVDVVTEIVDTIIDVLNAACAGSIILSILTAGAAGPFAALICSAAAFANTFIQPVVDAIASTSSLLRRLAETAPTDPTPGTFAQQIEHRLWGPDPPVVYVEGNIDVTARATSGFSNEACRNGGCPFDVTVTIYGIDITITIDVPYVVIPDLPVRCMLDFPAGTGGYEGFTDLGSPDDGVSCHFTGRDVPITSWVRGTYAVRTSSQCGNDLLGPLTRSFPLVSGPRLYSVSPTVGQLGAHVVLTGEYLPPLNVVSDINAASAEFGDARWHITGTAGPNVYHTRIGDTAAIAAMVGLRVQGRDAASSQLFTVLPPVLDFATLNPAFIGEEVLIHGSGFASTAALNVIKLNGVTVPTVRLEPDGPVFSVPVSALNGALQVFAVGHASNLLPFTVLHWNDEAALSHPDRDAANPVIAVAPGTNDVGVAWIDRHADGGEARLLFTDAGPNDVAFRPPVEIAGTGAASLETLSGWPQWPQQPALAAGPGGRFHIAFTDAFGEILVVSLNKGGLPEAAENLVPPTGTTYRDPSIAVMPDGSIHLTAVQVPIDGDPRNTLVQTRWPVGGLTFDPPVAFAGPGISAPLDAFHLGDVDLTYANGQLWRAYAGFSDACGYTFGTSAVREIFTQSSPDGLNWSAPAAAGACTTDNPNAGIASALRRAPSVSGDAAGALVAWDAPMAENYIPEGASDQWASRKVAANGAPYEALAIQPLTPTAWGYQSEGGRPSLVHGGSAQGTMVAWEQRDPGTSPDLMTGVPRVHFQRFRDHLATATLPGGQTPTASPLDTATIDTHPALAGDAAGNPHLVWLRGPVGHRTLYYLSTSTGYDDTLADNPPKVAAPARNLIAVRRLHGPIDGVEPAFGGVLLVDPDRPAETRWVATDHAPGTLELPGPSFAEDGSVVVYGYGDYYAPTLANPGGSRLVAADNFAAGDVLYSLERPRQGDDGRYYGLRQLPYYPGSSFYVPVVFRNEPGSNHFSPVPGLVLSNSRKQWGASHSGNLVAGFDSDHIPIVYNFATETLSAAALINGSGLEWAPSAEQLALAHSDYDSTCPSDPFVSCDAVSVWDAPTDTLTLAAKAQSIGPWLAWKPDGTDIAYVCSGLDCCGPGDTQICTTSGLVVPSEPAMTDVGPRWSPDGTAIGFIRYEGTGDGTRHLMVWHVGDPAATPVAGPYIGQHGWWFDESVNRIDWTSITP